MEENLKRELADARSNTRFLEWYGKGGTFLDLGANIGEVSIQASPHFDEVVAVESNPFTFKRMKKRVAAYKNIVTVNRAVWTTSGERMWCSMPRNSISSSARPKKRLKDDDYYVSVGSIAFSDLLRSYSPRVIKMDIEGAEYEVLKDFKLPACVKWMAIEFHGTRGPKFKDFLIIKAKLSAMGFKMKHPKAISVMDGKVQAKTFFFVAIFERVK